MARPLRQQIDDHLDRILGDQLSAKSFEGGYDYYIKGSTYRVRVETSFERDVEVTEELIGDGGHAVQRTARKRFISADPRRVAIMVAWWLEQRVLKARKEEFGEPAPVPNEGPSMHDLVIEDMKARKQFGLEKYSTVLQAFNGRKPLKDLYEELLDAVVYAKQALIEMERREADVKVDDLLQGQVPDEDSSAASPAQDTDDVGTPRVAGVPVREAQQADVAPDEEAMTRTEAKVRDTADRVEKILEVRQARGVSAFPSFGARFDGEDYQVTADDLRNLIYGARMWRRTKRDNDALISAGVQGWLSREDESDD